MALALTVLATHAPAASPACAPDPCCNPGQCRYRPGVLAFILKRFSDARAASPAFPVELREVIRDVLTEWEGEVALAERSRESGRHFSDRAHDMAIDILMACADLHCRPTQRNAARIADALCPFARMDDDDAAR